MYIHRGDRREGLYSVSSPWKDLNTAEVYQWWSLVCWKMNANLDPHLWFYCWFTKSEKKIDEIQIKNFTEPWLIIGSLGFCSMQFETHWHRDLLLDGKQSAGTQQSWKAGRVALLLTWTTEHRNDLSGHLVNSPKDTIWQVALHTVGVLGLSSPFSEKGWEIEEWGRLKNKQKNPPHLSNACIQGVQFSRQCAVLYWPSSCLLLESALSDLFVLWKAFNLIHVKGQNDVSEGSLSSLVVFLTEGFSLSSSFQHGYCRQNTLTHEVEKPPSFVVVYFEVQRLYILSFDFRNNREGSSPLQVLKQNMFFF